MLRCYIRSTNDIMPPTSNSGISCFLIQFTFFFLLALIGKLISSDVEQPDNTSSLDASKYAIGPKRKNKFSMKDSNVSGNKEVNKQNSTDQSIILESYLQRGGRESTISEPVEVQSALCTVLNNLFCK